MSNYPSGLLSSFPGSIIAVQLRLSTFPSAILANDSEYIVSAILNTDVSLEVFNSRFTYNGHAPAQAFIGGCARERKLVSAGTVLWKCTQFSLVNPSTGSITEWWCSAEDFDTTLERCKNLQISLRRYARSRLAVKWEWNNSMDNLLRARILQPVYAFVGLTKWQNTRFSIDKEATALPANRLALIGGDLQYCVPNLTNAHITKQSCTLADQLPVGWQTMKPYVGGRAG
jgi:hypothetical protein